METQDKRKRYVGNTRTQIDASKRVVLMNRNNKDRLLFMCTWTKSYLINLHCVHLYIYTIITQSINIFISLHFFDDWLYLTQRYSLTQSSLDCPTLLFQFIISFTLRPAVFEEKQNKIDVLSEEPYPLRRGRATGRANRLMMYDDDKDDDAHDGPALRSSGTCGWFLRCPG